MPSCHAELHHRIEETLKLDLKAGLLMLEKSKLVGQCPDITSLAFRYFEAMESNVARFKELSNQMVVSRNVGLYGEVKKEIIKTILGNLEKLD